MKNNIFELNGKDYYVLEEVKYEDKNYILVVECNLEKDTINDKDLHLMEYVKYKNEEIIKPIDVTVAPENVVAMMFKKIRG